MNILNLFRKVDNFREGLEDKLALILEKIDNSTKVDQLEEKLIATGLEYVVNYYGGSAIPDEVYTKASKVIVKAIGKGNKLVQKQLRKK